jgi:quaternary ammonium compound-resistance protein SugE
MSWLYLFTAGVFEIVFAIGLKHTAGFTKLLPIAITLVSANISLFLLSQSLKSLPVGTAYAIWTGIGSAGTAVLGMYLFNEPRAAARVVFLLLIISGIVGLSLTSEH